MKIKVFSLLLCLFFSLTGSEFYQPQNPTSDILEYKYVPSKYNELRIYQVMVESFQDGDSTRNYNDGYGTSHHRGDIRGIINALPYIKSLNVNAIWLTPIFDSEKGTPRINPDLPADVKLDATGYFPRNYFKIDPNFGSFEDAKELVDKAHELGLYVILDGVFGHNKGNVPPSPKGNEVVGKSDHVDFPESLEFSKEVCIYWIDQLNVDGWRLDQAYQMPIESLHELQHAVREHCQKRKSNGEKWGTLGYVVGEIFDVYQNIQVKGYGTDETPGLFSNFNFPMRYRIIQCLAGEEKKLRISDTKVLREGFETHRVYPSFSVPNLFLTNHDVVRFGDLIQRNGLENPDHINYWKRHQLAFAFMVAYTGPITLYYGDEIGAELDGFAEIINDPAEKCWEKGLCDDHVSRTSGKITNFTENEQELKNFVSNLMAFRTQHEALYNGRTYNLISGGNLYVDLKVHNEEKILFIMNIETKGDIARIEANVLDCDRLENTNSGKIINSKEGVFEIPVESLGFGFYYCK